VIHLAVAIGDAGEVERGLLQTGIWFFIIALRMLGLRLTYALTVPPASVTSNKVCSTTSGIFFSNSALALLQQLDSI
jgi:hypothetical protein